MSADYGYINARVRAMKGRLLPRETLYELLGAKDLDALGSTLGGTDYGHDLSEAQAHATGLAAIEESLRRNLCRTTAKLLEIADGKPGDLLGVILERWDLENVKAVLRGKHNRLTQAEILAGVTPAGRLDEARMTELAGAEDVKAVADMLATWRSPLSRPLTKALSGYGQDQSLANLELALDRAYVTDALEKVQKGDRNAGLVRKLLQEQIDAINFTTALRLRGESLEESRLTSFWVAGGDKIQERQFLALVRAADFPQALALAPAPLRFPEKPENEAGFERARVRSFALKGARLFRGDPLMINIPIGYLWMKTIEVTNLRLIARGKAFGIAQPEIERELLIL